MKTIIHGKYSTYNSHGCRCEDCKEANRQHQTKYRRKVPRLDTAPLIDRLIKDGRTQFIERNTIKRWHNNTMDIFQADRWCIKLGYHPIEIWGNKFYQD